MGKESPESTSALGALPLHPPREATAKWLELVPVTAGSSRTPDTGALQREATVPATGESL